MKLKECFKEMLSWLKQCPIFKKPQTTPPTTTSIKQDLHKDDVRMPMSEKELLDRNLNEQYGPDGDGPEWPHVRI